MPRKLPENVQKQRDDFKHRATQLYAKAVDCGDWKAYHLRTFALIEACARFEAHHRGCDLAQAMRPYHQLLDTMEDRMMAG